MVCAELKNSLNALSFPATIAQKKELQSILQQKIVRKIVPQLLVKRRPSTGLQSLYYSKIACKMKKIVLLLAVLVYVCVSVQAQDNVTLKGKVTDENGQPLAGVSIVSQKTKQGVKSDEEGAFSITIPKPENTLLVITYTGYKESQHLIAGTGTIQISMQRMDSPLEDVVVIGYQTVKRKDLTGSVSSVGARDIKDIPINSTAEALTGRLAGVQITTNEGSPGAEATIRVRGGGSITQDNSPLYIVDGIQVENALSVLAPQDIESVDVLKDASATAIYGARGANGVVIITTKGGKGTKTTVTYNGMVGVRQLGRRLAVQDPYEFVLYQYERSRGSEADRNGFLNTYGRWEDMELYKEAPFADWQDVIFGRNALMQTHNVSVGGGSQATRFNLSLTSNTEEGVMLLSDFDRKLVNFKLDHTISPKVKVGFTTRYNHTVINGAGTSNAGSSSTNRLRHSVKYRPILMGGQDLLDFDPDYALQTNANSLALVNPILINEAEYRKVFQNTINLATYFDFKINKYLSFRSTLGADLFNSRSDAFNDTITNQARQNGNQPLASVNTLERRTINMSNVFTFTMSKSGSRFSKKNDLDIIAGQELFEVLSKVNNIETRYFPVGITPRLALGNMGLGSAPPGATQPPPFSQELESKIFSLFGRVNYTYDKRFLASVSMRADGSSKFAEGNRWGYFPSASLAWRLSQEKWMERFFPTLSDAKLRISYGEAGNNRIADFLFMTQFVPTNAFYSISNQLISGYRPAALANANLVWETTVARNLGLDLGFFNNRLTMSIDAYINSTKDLLVNVPVPTSSGYTSQVQNVGETSNKGVEIQLSGTPISKKNLQWTTSFNISFNRNMVESLGSFQEFFLFSSGWAGGNQPSDYMIRAGQPVGNIWGLRTAGWYTTDDFDFNNGVFTLRSGVPNNQSITAQAPQPGSLKFEDINGDGVINDLDRTIIGNTQPRFFGGINNQVAWKNFDFSLFLNFVVGNQIYNANKLEFSSGYTPNSNMLAMMNERWKTIDANGVVVTDPQQLERLNANARIWRPLTSASSFFVHSWAVEDGSFLRVNNLTIGYTIPKKILSRAKISNLRVYATGNNLAILTNYSGYDPEVNTRRNTPLTPGVDYSAYPRSRAYIFGVNLSF